MSRPAAPRGVAGRRGRPAPARPARTRSARALDLGALAQREQHRRQQDRGPRSAPSRSSSQDTPSPAAAGGASTRWLTNVKGGDDAADACPPRAHWRARSRANVAMSGWRARGRRASSERWRRPLRRVTCAEASSERRTAARARVARAIARQLDSASARASPRRERHGGALESPAPPGFLPAQPGRDQRDRLLGGQQEERGVGASSRGPGAPAAGPARNRRSPTGQARVLQRASGTRSPPPSGRRWPRAAPAGARSPAAGRCRGCCGTPPSARTSAPGSDRHRRYAAQLHLVDPQLAQR